MKNQRLLIFIVAILLFSCKPRISGETYSEFKKKGEEITNVAQAVLLLNVSQAMQTGGAVFAVEFCNLKASSIVDSLNLSNNCVISRISAKNRNKANILKTETDKNVWDASVKGFFTDTLIQENKKLVYYKVIKTAFPACLKCHGIPGENIDAETVDKLNQLYPNDLATGYRLNDFRGLWKVEFVGNR